MLGWFLIFAGFYLLGLIYSAYKSDKMMKDEKDYILPKLGVILGFLTYSATLFSTFTLMGMPNFFRVHGVGSWIFLGVTDTAMGVMLILFGVFLRRRFSKDNFYNVSMLIEESYNSKFAGYVYKIGIFKPLRYVIGY
jgi:SSS family solute:Na+ symporter